METETKLHRPETVSRSRQPKFGCLWRIVLGTLGIVIVTTIFLFLAYNHNLYRGADHDGPLVILGGTLFDGTGEAPYPNSKIVITGGRFVCMGTGCKSPPDATVIHATGLSIIPGLIDLHVHFGAPSRENRGLSMPALMWEYWRHNPRVRRAYLYAGVTTIRSVGDSWDFILSVKHKIESGTLAGPRIFTAGPIFTAPGGHPVSTHFKGNPWLIEHAARQVSNSDQAALEVQKLAREGVDGIKVVYGGRPRLQKDVLQAIVESAQKRGLWVAVHANTPEEVGDAVEAGADTIEHGVNHKSALQPSLIALLKKRQVTYIPTLAVYASKFRPESPRIRKIMKNLLAASSGGVSVGCGTDTQGPTMSFGDSVHRELELMVGAGLSPKQALLSATRNAATALKADKDLGSIEAGKVADLVLVDGKPWLAIADTRKIQVVVQAGRVVVDSNNSTQ